MSVYILILGTRETDESVLQEIVALLSQKTDAQVTKLS